MHLCKIGAKAAVGLPDAAAALREAAMFQKH